MKASEKVISPHIDKWIKWKHWLLFFVVPLLSLVAIQPILTGILPWRGDGLLHLYRLAELERAVRAGVFLPRWSPDLGIGFGFPLFNYYAPFSYYVGLLPRLLGFSLPVSMAVSYILSLWVLGWGVWLWARDLWQSWLATITAVLAILYAPYTLYNTYHRAALAELWGLAFLGLTLWAVYRIFRDWGLGIRDWGNPFVLLAIFYGLLILSHNITALIGTPLIVGYAIFLTINNKQETRNRKQKNITHHVSRITSFILHPSSLILISLLLGLGLSAFFWLPAFFERHLVQIENLTATASFSYLNHFLTLRNILALPQTAVSQQVNPNIPRALSWPILILAVLAWLPMGTGDRGSGIGDRRSRNTHHASRFILHPSSFILFVTLLCLFMVLPLSQPIWQTIDLLSFVQFPWRFLGPTSLFLAMLAGLGAQQLLSFIRSQFTIHNSLFTIVLTALIILYALPWLFPSQAHSLPNDISAAETAVFEQQTGWLGTTAAADYLPNTVQTVPTPDGLTTHLDTTQFPDSFTITDLQESYTAVSLTYDAAEPETAVFHIFHFPGWQATLDESPIEIMPSDPHGLITIQLPTGTHTLQLAFGSTSLRTIANIISLPTLAFLLILIAHHASRITHHLPNNQQKTENRKQGTKKLNNRQFFIPHPSSFILPAILTVLVIFVLKTAVLDHNNTPFHINNYASRIPVLSNAEGTHHDPINFNNTIQLIGTDLPTTPLPADQPIHLTLYWQALPPVNEEVSISVQLIGANNTRYAQSDSFHPAGLPLPRWQAGEFGSDQHSLTALPATPPGAYDLTVFVYNLATGQRLNTLNENNLPVGNEYHLGTITLTSPTQFPEPAQLMLSKRETEGGGESPILLENAQLLGYDQPLTEITVGQTIPLTLFWHTPQTPPANYSGSVSLTCEHGEEIATLPLPQDNTPNTSWQAGEIRRVDTAVPIRPINENGTAIEDGFCTLYLNLQAEDSAQGIALETFPITAPKRHFDIPETAVSINQSLANQLTLAAIDLDQTSVAAGKTLPLILYWQPEALFTEDYKVFVQLLGENGRILTQQDKIPANGTRPTTGWIPAEIIYDTYELTIPADAPAGSYQLITGLYNAQTNQRLTLADQSGDAITIPIPIEVKLAE